VERYARAETAERAGVSVEELSRLVELGILRPDAEDRFSEGDVRRVGVMHSLVAAAILSTSGRCARRGDLSLDFMDDPAYSLFASLTGETFQELSARTGVPLQLLTAVREATGSAAPAPGDRVREDEMTIVPLLEFQLAHRFRPITVERNLRVWATACVASPRRPATRGAPRCSSLCSLRATPGPKSGRPPARCRKE
jgi:hypothetical protein